LWKAFLESLVQNITITSINPEINVGQVSDNYTSSSQNLSREFTASDPAFQIRNIGVNNNKLSVKLNRMN
jgi:hypothetical protein